MSLFSYYSGSTQYIQGQAGKAWDHQDGGIIEYKDNTVPETTLHKAYNRLGVGHLSQKHFVMPYPVSITRNCYREPNYTQLDQLMSKYSLYTSKIDSIDSMLTWASRYYGRDGYTPQSAAQKLGCSVQQLTELVTNFKQYVTTKSIKCVKLRYSPSGTWYKMKDVYYPQNDKHVRYPSQVKMECPHYTTYTIPYGYITSNIDNVTAKVDPYSGLKVLCKSTYEPIFAAYFADVAVDQNNDQQYQQGKKTSYPQAQKDSYITVFKKNVNFNFVETLQQAQEICDEAQWSIVTAYPFNYYNGEDSYHGDLDLNGYSSQYKNAANNQSIYMYLDRLSRQQKEKASYIDDASIYPQIFTVTPAVRYYAPQSTTIYYFLKTDQPVQLTYQLQKKVKLKQYTMAWLLYNPIAHTHIYSQYNYMYDVIGADPGEPLQLLHYNRLSKTRLIKEGKLTEEQIKQIIPQLDPVSYPKSFTCNDQLEKVLYTSGQLKDGVYKIPSEYDYDIYYRTYYTKTQTEQTQFPENAPSDSFYYYVDESQQKIAQLISKFQLFIDQDQHPSIVIAQPQQFSDSNITVQGLRYSVEQYNGSKYQVQILKSLQCGVLANRYELDDNKILYQFSDSTQLTIGLPTLQTQFCLWGSTQIISGSPYKWVTGAAWGAGAQTDTLNHWVKPTVWKWSWDFVPFKGLYSISTSANQYGYLSTFAKKCYDVQAKKPKVQYTQTVDLEDSLQSHTYWWNTPKRQRDIDYGNLGYQARQIISDSTVTTVTYYSYTRPKYKINASDQITPPTTPVSQGDYYIVYSTLQHSGFDLETTYATYRRSGQLFTFYTNDAQQGYDYYAGMSLTHCWSPAKLVQGNLDTFMHHPVLVKRYYAEELIDCPYWPDGYIRYSLGEKKPQIGFPPTIYYIHQVFPFDPYVWYSQQEMATKIEQWKGQSQQIKLAYQRPSSSNQRDFDQIWYAYESQIKSSAAQKITQLIQKQIFTWQYNDTLKYNYNSIVMYKDNQGQTIYETHQDTTEAKLHLTVYRINKTYHPEQYQAKSKQGILRYIDGSYIVVLYSYKPASAYHMNGPDPIDQFYSSDSQTTVSYPTSGIFQVNLSDGQWFTWYISTGEKPVDKHQDTGWVQIQDPVYRRQIADTTRINPFYNCLANAKAQIQQAIEQIYKNFQIKLPTAPPATASTNKWDYRLGIWKSNA